MRRNRFIIFSLLVMLMLACVSIYVWDFHFTDVYNQPQTVAKNPQTSIETAAIRGQTVIWTTTNDAANRLLLNENARLESSLAWAFGGKIQRGWAIYLPLICQTIGADLAKARGAESDFAVRLAVWQRDNGVRDSGTLDAETWKQMITMWQANRLKNRETPPPAQMMLAPTIDFWDLERPAEQRYVERATYDAYKRMVRAAIADSSLNLRATSNGELSIAEKQLKIVSAYRSRERQAQLRRESPNSGRAGLAVNSPHFSGRALDLYIAGDPVDTKDSNRMLQTSTPLYRWLVQNASRYGFKPYFYEPWHWEFDLEIKR